MGWGGGGTLNNMHNIPVMFELIRECIYFNFPLIISATTFILAGQFRCTYHTRKTDAQYYISDGCPCVRLVSRDTSCSH